MTQASYVGEAIIINKDKIGSTMSAKELFDWIDSLAQDIDFEYHGKSGSICPFSRSDISLCYNGEEVTVHSVEAAMREPFLDGHSLEELAEELRL
ncbi:hypothetical protein [Pseudoflavonifractor phocaeensis]|uniref:hypothetical protein n=2 Tax=Pseudoflavonifractor phocaeensis TaxID=1870988 RepID=UPI00195B616D|nr:hypothetical protein [Pseudoflavonifractor phocaeensis]